MIIHRAQCRWESDDYLTAERSGDAVHVVAFNEDGEAANASLNVDVARVFARGILALADEIDGGEAASHDDSAAQNVKVGDRVLIVREWENDTSPDDGKSGTLDKLDLEDDAFPYRVRTDSDSHRTVWVHEIQRERATTDADAADPSVAPGRAAYIEEAWKLAGEYADPADVLKYARFLAGE
ncbi:hypothetical protein ACFRNT_11305 [Streptomyces sp. NPDC056697]|uniref:hypothetical protein n=1 Tax=Streptomyces sp. NPDC056697 TaxID=3345915 RepID=UPI00368A4E66